MNSSLRAISSSALDQMRRAEPARRIGVIVPVGAVEQHGPLLPVTCDVDIAEGAAAALAQGLSGHPRYLAFAAPPIAYGPVPGAERTHGTAAVSYEDVGRYVSAVAAGFARTGTWTFLILLNAHGHNHGRVIEASATVYAEYRVPVLAIHVYEFTSVAAECGLTAGSHAGEFEMAAHAHYTGATLPAAELNDGPAPRPRPASVYGLDVLPRSFSGVVAPERPSPSRALAVSHQLGCRLDELVLAKAVADLDVYFSHWTGPEPT